jgi:bifunctional damage-control phosphatase, subfamily II, fusion protein
MKSALRVLKSLPKTSAAPTYSLTVIVVVVVVYIYSVDILHCIKVNRKRGSSISIRKRRPPVSLSISFCRKFPHKNHENSEAKLKKGMRVDFNDARIDRRPSEHALEQTLDQVQFCSEALAEEGLTENCDCEEEEEEQEELTAHELSSKSDIANKIDRRRRRQPSSSSPPPRNHDQNSIVQSQQSSNNNAKPAAPPITLPRQREAVKHFALDLGGSLIKLVYFSVNADQLGGRLHFRRFPASSLNECIQFIERKKLHLNSDAVSTDDSDSTDNNNDSSNNKSWREEELAGGKTRKSEIKATGGGSFKHQQVFRDLLGIELQKEDEMACAVRGANFLLKTIRDEAFTFEKDTKTFVEMSVNNSISHNSNSNSSGNLFPYLLVNIGSGVASIKVTENGHERISGTNIGGGTFWGLCRLLTGMRDYDEMLKCSQDANSARVDMLVGDIYGRDYEKVGLSSDLIASSFGKVVMEEGDLTDYSKADITLSLLRMISYNIAHLATLTAKAHGLERIFFGGYFIRGHAYTMNTISFAVNFWSKGGTRALFLRHEGFLGALGAFLSDTTAKEKLGAAETRGSWIEKFIKYSSKENFSKHSKSTSPSPPPPQSHSSQQPFKRSNSYTSQSSKGEEILTAATAAMQLSDEKALAKDQPQQRHLQQNRHHRGYSNLASHLGVRGASNDFDVGVLHYAPTLEIYPLLKNPESYVPDTFDLQASTAISAEDREYWLKVLKSLTAGVAEHARNSQQGDNEEDESEDRRSSARASLDEKNTFVNYDAYDFESNNRYYRKKTAAERAEQFRNAYDSLLDRLLKDPFGYGKISLSSLFEAREECLRDCGFADAYEDVKQHENDAAIVVLPELLDELEQMTDERRRLIQIVEGVLAGNVFDWGSQACVDLYNNGTILDIYKSARKNATRLSWKIDGFEEFSKRLNEDGYKKAHFFVDNSGADIVLGVLPFVVELLRRKCKVVLVANDLPALNDVTAYELRVLLNRAAETCQSIKSALLENALSVVSSGNGGPCIDLRRSSQELIDASQGVDLVILEGMGRAVHTNYNASFTCDSLKLAMIKNARLADRLCSGEMFDCVVRFDRK